MTRKNFQNQTSLKVDFSLLHAKGRVQSPVLDLLICIHCVQSHKSLFTSALFNNPAVTESSSVASPGKASRLELPKNDGHL